MRDALRQDQTLYSRIYPYLIMNIQTLHSEGKAVSAKSLFKGGEGNLTTIQLLENSQLKEHITKVPALLVCVVGKVVFNNEQGIKETLLPGDYINIEPMVKHWLDATLDSQLLLFK